MAASISRILGLHTLESCASRVSVSLANKRSLTSVTAQPVPQSAGLLTVRENFERCNFHTSSAMCWERPHGPRNWLKYNERKFPPTPLGEEERPAFVCHLKKNIKYSPSKMWYVASLVRGLRIDDAINQLKFVHKKGSVAARETLEEARDLAVKDHNVEFPSNLWVSESFVGKGMVIRGFRRHARSRFGKVEYKYCHYFVTLEEGEPPEHYYPHRRPLTPQEMLQEWIDNQRQRTITRSL
ncbi:39S ribosomal protein L22, mitochondrial-like [Homarus americanus]|uniref:39S ribosomal protein L22, mitochondrial-like n=1 Tax=Homarus americanus TaxID=6706 RepID=UPI001C472853|nr:39S ribosomal protein L22, mitochondrial-like [Homarus americanus]